MNSIPVDTTTTALLRARLLELARRLDELAANEAATTPYWKPQPVTVDGNKAAADALRAEADRLLATS